jgi:hypothetical protein
MRKATLLSIALILPLVLAACGGAAAAPPGQSQTPAGGQPSDRALNADYEDALPIAAQLILGSLDLEEGDLAISVEQAKQLLPLWQAYQSLSGKETTAAAELDAVLRQVQNAMTAEQLAAVASMQLTTADITASMPAPGEFGGPGDGSGRAAANGGDMPRPPDGAMPFGGGPGGGPGGGFLGGEQLSPEARATALAERMAENPELAATFMTRGILNQLITALQLKTGDVTQEELQAQQAQRVAMRWLPAVSEATGIAVDKLIEAMGSGKTLAEAIQAEGGDVSKAETAIREMLKNAPNADEKALEDQVSAALNSKAPAPPPSSQ